MDKNNSKSNVLTFEDMRDMLKSKTSYENCYDLKNSVLIESYDDSKFDEIKSRHDMEITKDLELEREKTNFKNSMSKFAHKVKKQKIEKFVSGSSDNIYINPGSARGPETFQTGEFFQTDDHDVKKVDNLQNIKITQTDSFYKIQKQRNKKIKNFNCSYSTIHGSNMRPLYDAYDSSYNDNGKSASKLSIDNNWSEQIEYRSKHDLKKVNKYLQTSKKKYMISTIILTFLFLISIIWQLGVFNYFYLPPSLTLANPLSYIFLNFWVLIVATIPFYSVLHSGISGLVKLKPNSDSALCVMLLGNICQVAMLLFSGTEMINNKNIFVLTPVVIGGMAFHCMSKYIHFVVVLSNFRFVCNKSRKGCTVGVASNEDLISAFKREKEKHDPMVIYKRKTNFFTDFIYYSSTQNIADSVGYFLTPIGFYLSVLLLLISAVISKNMWVAITVFASGLCIITPFSFLFSIVLPFFISQKKLCKNKAAFLGFDSSKFGKTDAIIITAKELFPKGTVNLSGMRVFNSHPIDDSITCAASVLTATNSILKDMFMSMILENERCLEKVDSILYEDNMGISAWVDDRRVIIGNYYMMVNHNINMPPDSEIKKISKNGCDYVFVAISGKLTAAFMYDMSADFNVKSNLDALENEGISVVIKTVDVAIKPKKLSKIFKTPENLFKILPAQYHKSYRNQTRDMQKDGSAIISGDDFISFSSAIIESKKFLTCLKFGIITYILGIFIEILVLVLFISVNMVYKFSSITIILFNLSVLLSIVLINIFIKK